MKVIAFDPILTQMKADALGVELVNLDQLIERSDFISVHAPKTEKTNNLIKTDELRRMKPSCRIVNCARGGIINEADLAQALREKVIAGAALDVYTTEPLENNPFLGLDNIVTTPHLAASTDEAQLVVAVDIAKQIVDYLTTGAIINAVNVPSLDSEQRKALQPLLFLAEKLGRFQSGFMRGRPISIGIEYAGDLGVTDTYPLSAAVLMGFLAPLVESVNLVSAPVMLKHHGIQYSETRRAIESHYAFEIGVKVTTDQESHRVAGTLFSKDDPRICTIDDIRMDAHPEGWILVCLNEDKPRTIGTVATILGDAGINIANLTLGRVARGGLATTLLNLDEPVPEAVLDTLRKAPHVREVRLVAL